MRLFGSFVLVAVSSYFISSNANPNGKNLRVLSSVTLASTTDADWDLQHGKLTIGYEGDKCTTIVVGPKAGIEGPMTTHTADCSDCDFRIGKVRTFI